MAVSGHKSQIKVSGTPTAMTNEATTDLATPTVRRTYRITNAAKRCLDPQATINVEKDIGAGFVAANPTEYVLDRLAGTIAFASQLASPGTVRVTGTYLPMAVVAEAISFKISGSANWPKDSAMGDTFETRDVVPTKDVVGALGRWKLVDTALFDQLIAGTPVVVEIWSDAGAVDWDIRAWALFNGDELSANWDAIVEEGVDFEGTPDADKRAISFNI